MCYAQNGRPVRSRKFSLTHINQAFNKESQIDFLFPTVRGCKPTVLNVTYTGTNYSELVQCESRTANIIIQAIDTTWIY